MHATSVTDKVKVPLELCFVTLYQVLCCLSQDLCIAKLTKHEEYAGVASPVMTAFAE